MVRNVKKYDIVYSIGRDCASTMYLKNHNLRLTSGPFDWLTNANFEDRLKCLLNDFHDFLQITDLKKLTKNPNIDNDENCDYYENVKTNFYFYHDFPIDIPLKDSFDNVNDKYKRRIGRFLKNIKNKKRILFVWFSHYTWTDDKIIMNLCNQYCKKINKQIDFLIIENDKTKQIGELLSYQLAPNIIRYCISTNLQPNTIMGNIEDVNKILSLYAVKQPFKIVQKIKKSNGRRNIYFCGVKIFSYKKSQIKHT